MKTKIPKNKNVVHGDLVKKANRNLVVYSNEPPVIKTDAKLTKAEQEKKTKMEKKQIKK